MRKMIGLLLGVSLAASVASSQTTTLYKHVDKDGKVTYTDKPPPKNEEPRKDGTSTKKLGMDNERNVIKAPPKSSDAPDTRAADNKRKKETAAKEKEYEEARKAYDAARAAFEAGKDPRDDEWRTVGVSKGSPARVPNEAYEERIKKLEAAVTAAEQRLREAERALR
jgi:hypothetical protein